MAASRGMDSAAMGRSVALSRANASATGVSEEG